MKIFFLFFGKTYFVEITNKTFVKKEKILVKTENFRRGKIAAKVAPHSCGPAVWVTLFQ